MWRKKYISRTVLRTKYLKQQTENENRKCKCNFFLEKDKQIPARLLILKADFLHRKDMRLLENGEFIQLVDMTNDPMFKRVKALSVISAECRGECAANKLSRLLEFFIHCEIIE